VKHLILLLHSELEAYKSSGSVHNASVLRQGVLVLQALAVAANAGKSRSFESLYASVRGYFLLLMSGVVQLLRRQQLSVPEHESMFRCVLS